MSQTLLPMVDGGHLQSEAPPLSLEVHAMENPQRTDEKINTAIQRLIPAALERNQGILVIQRDFGKFTIRIDPEVPCGTTQESWNRLQEVTNTSLGSEFEFTSG
ncbi:hypothetical protein GA0061083_0068 [Pseudarthrobacter enclensis]|nr:hypothetical protein GA0061083_0068 [Pseudarthrobacter enclensis]